MKHFMKSWIFNVCNLCIALAGVFHFSGMSILFFGEQPYPEEN